MGSAVVTITPDQAPVTITPDSVSAPERSQGPSTYERLTGGYNTDVEDWAQNHPHVGPIVRFLDAAGGAAMKSPEMLVDAIKQAATPPPLNENGNVDIKAVAKRSLDPGNLLPSWESVTNAAKFWSDPAKRKAVLGLLPEALGQATGTVAGAEATGKATGLAGDVAGKATNKAAQVLAPAKPQLLEAAQAAIHPTEIPGRILKAAVNAIPDQPTYPGAPLPATDEFYANRGAELDRIRKMQDMEARRAARQTSQTQRAQSGQSPTSQGTSSPSPVVQSSSPSLSSEGRPATWTNQTVLQRAATGDMTAIQQARLRALPMPENTNFVGNKAATVTPQVGTPRSVTTFDSEGNPVGPTAPSLKGGPTAFNKLTLSDGEDLGPGMGTDHIIRDRAGNRVGSVQIEPKGEDTVHVHWLGGEFGPNARGPLMDAIKEQYPGTERITYDRRRLAKGASAATTEPREMQLP